MDAVSLSSLALSFSPRGSSGSFGLFGGWMIMNLQVSSMFQAALSSCPTLGTPPATVKPMEPAWYMGALRMHTWLPRVMSLTAAAASDLTALEDVVREMPAIPLLALLAAVTLAAAVAALLAAPTAAEREPLPFPNLSSIFFLLVYFSSSRFLC